MLVASAELCLLRAVEAGPVPVKDIPKAARLWFREHKHRMAPFIIEQPPGTLRKATASKVLPTGPCDIANSGGDVAELIASKKAFILGANTIIYGPYTTRGSDEAKARWFSYQPPQSTRRRRPGHAGKQAPPQRLARDRR